MFAFVVRQPFAILGAIGLISLFHSFLTLPAVIEDIVSAYQVVTRNMWYFLFGWLSPYISLKLPEIVQDYLSMGLISSAALSRYFYSVLKHPEVSREVHSQNAEMYPMFLFANLMFYTTLFWPFIFLANIAQYMSKDERYKNSTMVYFDFICWAIAIILLSYGMLFVESVK